MQFTLYTVQVCNLICIIDKCNDKYAVPGQECSLQGTCLDLFPAHPGPFIQILTSCCVPPPQDNEQFPSFFHFPQTKHIFYKCN